MIWADLDGWKRRARALRHEPYGLHRDLYLGGGRPLAYTRNNSR